MSCHKIISSSSASSFFSFFVPRSAFFKTPLHVCFHCAAVTPSLDYQFTMVLRLATPAAGSRTLQIFLQDVNISANQKTECVSLLFVVEGCFQLVQLWSQLLLCRCPSSLPYCRLFLTSQPFASFFLFSSNCSRSSSRTWQTQSRHRTPNIANSS